MDIEDILVNGQVFGSTGGSSKKSTSKWPKKKLSGAQQMRADYKKRFAAKAVSRAKGKGNSKPTT